VPQPPLIILLFFFLLPTRPPLMTSFSFPTTTVRATTQRFLEPAPVGIGMRGRAVASAFDGIVGFAREEEFGEFGEGEVRREEEEIEHGAYFFFLSLLFVQSLMVSDRRDAGIVMSGFLARIGWW